MMGFLDDILNNRELAVLVWLVVMLFWALAKRNIRDALAAVIKAFFKKIIVITTFLMLLYIGLMVFIAYRAGFWDIALLGDTVFWIVGVAFVMYININRAKDDNYFKNAILDNIKLVVVLEFITNLYVFDFWVELIVVPILAILGGVSAVSASNPKYKQIHSCLTKIVAIIGLGFLSFAIYNIVVDFRGFASTDTVKEFFLPFTFTVWFLPFVYIFALYIAYDQVFRRIKRLIPDASVARYTRWKTILSFNLNLKALYKWLDRIVRGKINTKADVRQAISEVKRANA